MRPKHLAFIASLACLAAPASAQHELPPVAGLRADEDWTDWCAAAPDDLVQARLKCIRPAPGLLLSVGGETRIRAELVDDPDLGLGSPRDQAILTRLLLHADLRAGSSLRLFAQFGSMFASGRETGDGPTDENRLDLAQGFLEISGPAGGGAARLRAGRQEMTLGSSRLVSVRESPNVRRAFDGIRASWHIGEVSIDAFRLRPVTSKQGMFDDGTDQEQSLQGVYARLPIAFADSMLDLYHLGLEREGAVFTETVADERRHSLGVRLAGSSGPFDWDLEAVRQTGSLGRARIRAWSIASDFGLTLPRLPAAPRLGFKADVASGDARLGDGRLGTFNALFPRLPYFTEAGLVRPLLRR